MLLSTTARAAALASLGAGLALRAAPAIAQSPADARAGVPAGCTYRTCALRVEPSWGARLVRGAAGERVSSVGGFGTGVRVLLDGPDSARVHARGFQSASRVASTLGLVSTALWVTSAVRSGWWREVDRTDRALLLGASGLTLISIPVATKAQRELSRSIWWYNEALPR